MSHLGCERWSGLGSNRLEQGAGDATGPFIRDLVGEVEFFLSSEEGWPSLLLGFGSFWMYLIPYHQRNFVINLFFFFLNLFILHMRIALSLSSDTPEEGIEPNYRWL